MEKGKNFGEVNLNTQKMNKGPGNAGEIGVEDGNISAKVGVTVVICKTLTVS